MRISILYTILGGFFLAISHIWSFRASWDQSFLTLGIPVVLLLVTIVIGILHMRSVNHGNIVYKEGFFTGLNISIGSGIFAALIFWFYFTDIAPESFAEILNRKLDDPEAYATFGSQALMGIAFQIFLLTAFPGLLGAMVVARFIKSVKRE